MIYAFRNKSGKMKLPLMKGLNLKTGLLYEKHAQGMLIL